MLTLFALEDLDGRCVLAAVDRLGDVVAATQLPVRNLPNNINQ